MFQRQVFRQYDIRGQVGVEINNDLVIKIAYAFAKQAFIFGENRIIVGRDNRSSSIHFRDLVIEALRSSGMDVIDIGEVITPMFYFAAHHYKIKAGIMITASHNPGSDNGFKLLLDNSTIYGDKIQELAHMVEHGEKLMSSRIGSIAYRSIEKDYVTMLMQRIELGERKLKVVVDCGNGTASSIAPQVLEKWGCEVIRLYCESDPSFPNHHPDPIKVENCADLIKEVLRTNADLGIGFDGDGDRLGVVGPDGSLIWGDLLMILFWREILPKYPGTNCIVEVKCSQSLIDEIEKLGGKVQIYKTGHSLIKARMKEISAVFTGEMSGHMFFADEFFGFDDAIYAAGRLLRILSNSAQSITDMLASIPKYYSTPELRIKSNDNEKFNVVKKVNKHFQDLYPIIDIDGARIVFPNGWGLVRASNTGPELIARCEGNSPTALAAIEKEMFEYLDSIGLQQ